MVVVGARWRPGPSIEGGGVWRRWAQCQGSRSLGGGEGGRSSSANTHCERGAAGRRRQVGGEGGGGSWPPRSAADPSRERRGDNGGQSAWLKEAAPLLGAGDAPLRILVVSGATAIGGR